MKRALYVSHLVFLD
jgi:tubulin-specific chaperone D